MGRVLSLNKTVMGIDIFSNILCWFCEGASWGMPLKQSMNEQPFSGSIHSCNSSFLNKTSN